MNTMYFTNCKSLEDVEKTYKEIYRIFDLEKQPVNHFIRKAVDEQYVDICKAFSGKDESSFSPEN